MKQELESYVTHHTSGGKTYIRPPEGLEWEARTAFEEAHKAVLAQHGPGSSELRQKVMPVEPDEYPSKGWMRQRATTRLIVDEWARDLALRKLKEMGMPFEEEAEKDTSWKGRVRERQRERKLETELRTARWRKKGGSPVADFFSTVVFHWRKFWERRKKKGNCCF